MTDYDRTDIPARYDRARDHGPEMLDLWMRAIAALVEGRSLERILDLGCGTGRFSDALAAHFNAAVMGVDPSTKMLDVAREKQRDARVHYQLGRAEDIPLESASVDMVFMSMSLHHFADPLAAARECRRVLRSTGMVFIRTGTRERIPSYPYVPFFTSSPAILETLLPSGAEIRAIFTAADLHPVASQLITQTVAPDWMAYADKLAIGADSALAQLSPHDFAAGMAAVRRHATEAGRQPVVEHIDLFVFAAAAPK